MDIVFLILMILFILICIGYLFKSSNLSDSDSKRLSYLRTKIQNKQTLTSQEKIDYFFLNIKLVIALVCFIAGIYFVYSFYKIFKS